MGPLLPQGQHPTNPFQGPINIDPLLAQANQPGLAPIRQHSQPHPGAAVLPNQPGPVPTGQNHLPQADGAGLPLAPASGVPAPSPQTGNIPRGTPGATALVPTTFPGDPRLQDMLDNLDLTGTPAGTPSFNVTLPHLFQDPIGTARKITDPRYVLAHDIPDLTWDDYNIRMSSAIDFLAPNPLSPRPSQQIVRPPLAIGHSLPPPIAQSVPPPPRSVSPRYPHIPLTINSPYGSHPNQPPVVPFRPVSPPIKPGSLASPPVVTASPAVPTTTQPVPLPMNAPGTPVLTSS